MSNKLTPGGQTSPLAGIGGPGHATDHISRDWLLLGKYEKLSMAQIIDAVSLETLVPVHVIKGGRRDKDAVRSRYIAAYLVRKLTDKSLPEMGIAFGGRDHSTILSGIRNMRARLEKDEALKRLVQLCESRAFRNRED